MLITGEIVVLSKPSPLVLLTSMTLEVPSRKRALASVVLVARLEEFSSAPVMNT